MFGEIFVLTAAQTFIMAFVIGTAAFIITKSKLFENFRDQITHPFFKKLINCPYCLSFWLAALWIGLYFFEIFLALALLIFLIGGLGGIAAILITWICKKADL